MSDLYTEVIVKRKPRPIDMVERILLIAGTVISVLLFLTTTLGIIALLLTAAFAAADFFLLPGLDVEFEYLYVNGELDVDKIMSKQKRKRVYSANIREMEILAPSDSHVLDSYNRKTDLKVHDFSSGDSSNKSYTMIIKGEKQMEKVIFEPNQVMLNDMKRMAPREVNLY